MVSTQAREWLETDTQQMLEVTSPDNILVNGRLSSGGVASVHIASNPWAGSGYRMEIYGREGTLTVSSDESPQLDDVKLQGAQGNNSLQDLEIPAKYTVVLEGMPSGSPFNVGQMYYRFGESIRSGITCEPNFDTAVELHRFIDDIRRASDQGREVEVDMEVGLD